MELTTKQRNDFSANLYNIRVDDVVHLVYRTVNSNVEGVTRRPHVVSWYLLHGRWPGRLKKTCSVPRCVTHYEEIRKVNEPLTDKSWGAGRAYAEKYNVSPTYISRLRKKDD